VYHNPDRYGVGWDRNAVAWYTTEETEMDCKECKVPLQANEPAGEGVCAWCANAEKEQSQPGWDCGYCGSQNPAPPAAGGGWDCCCCGSN